jgi:hypothetical protein
MNREHQHYDVDFAESATYRIVAEGDLDPSYCDRLAGMSISTTNRGDRKPLATLTGKVIDQTALNGVLDTLYSIHLPILSVERIDDVD